MTPAAVKILNWLSKHTHYNTGQRTCQEVALTTGYSRQTVMKAIKVLEREGKIRVRHNNGDRRGNWYMVVRKQKKRCLFLNSSQRYRSTCKPPYVVNYSNYIKPSKGSARVPDEIVIDPQKPTQKRLWNWIAMSTRKLVERALPSKDARRAAAFILRHKCHKGATMGAIRHLWLKLESILSQIKSLKQLFIYIKTGRLYKKAEQGYKEVETKLLISGERQRRQMEEWRKEAEAQKEGWRLIPSVNEFHSVREWVAAVGGG